MDYEPEADLLDSLIDGLIEGISGTDESDYSSYSGNMVGWIQEVLGAGLWDKLIEIVESVENNPYTAVQSANGVGKTYTAARIVLAWLNIYRYNCKVISTAAPPERQIKELMWGEIKDAWRKAKEKGIKLVGGSPGAMSIRMNSTWWAQGFTIPQTGTREDRIARFQGHHAEHLLFILDEAHGIPLEIYEAMDSCISGGHNHVLVLSNPLAPSGPFYEVVRDPKYNVIQIDAFDHPNVKKNRIIFPGCVTREKTTERLERWSRALTDEETKDASCFQVPEWYSGPLAGQWRKVTFPFLDTKTLARFPSQSEHALISLAWIQQAQDRWVSHPPMHIQSVADAKNLGGLDVAEMGIDANSFIRRKGSWVSKIERWNGIDLIQTGGKATAKAKEHNIDTMYVDANGLGAGVAPHLRANGVKAVGVKVTEIPTVKVVEGEFNRMRDQLLWAIREWLRTDENSMLPPDEMLLQELSVLTYEQDIRGKIVVLPKPKIREIIGRSPDALDSLALTFFVGKQYEDIEFVSV